MLVVHASDLHLGRPLRALPKLTTLDREAFRHCAFRTLSRLVSLALAEGAGLILLAGDLIEESVRNYKIGLRLIAELSRLEGTGTEVVWVRGNHDAENRVIGNLMRPSHIHEIGLSGVQTLQLRHLGVAVVGSSYRERACYEDLLAAYPPKTGDSCVIGLLHTSGDGAITDDRYAPCRRSELIGKGYDYFALGHVHQPTILSNKVPVTYSGSLQGRSFHESGPRGCRLVRFVNGAVTSMEHCSLETVRFGGISVDVSQARSFDAVLEAIWHAAQSAALQHPQRALVARFHLTGDGAAHYILGTNAALRGSGLASLMSKMPARLAADGFWFDAGHPEVGRLELTADSIVREDVE